MVSKSLFSSVKMDWRTPPNIFGDAQERWGPFTIDLAADEGNALCDRFYDESDDSLSETWRGIGWLNPPYGRGIGDWVRKAHQSVLVDRTALRVVMLIPARTDTKYFHKWIYEKEGVSIVFLKGRLRFSGSKNAAPFPSMFVVFDGRLHEETPW